MPSEYDRIGHGAEWDGTDIDARVKIEALEQRIAVLEQRLELVDQHIEFSTEEFAREMLRVKHRQSLEQVHEQALLENLNNGAVTWLCSPGMSAWSTGGTRSAALSSCGTGWRAITAGRSSPPAR